MKQKTVAFVYLCLLSVSCGKEGTSNGSLKKKLSVPNQAILEKVWRSKTPIDFWTSTMNVYSVFWFEDGKLRMESQCVFPSGRTEKVAVKVAVEVTDSEIKILEDGRKSGPIRMTGWDMPCRVEAYAGDVIKYSLKGDNKDTLISITIDGKPLEYYGTPKD